MNDPASEILDQFRTPIPMDEGLIQLRRDSIDQSAGAIVTPPAGSRPEVRRLHPFEVYITGYTSGAATSAKVIVATGTILKSESDIEDIANIAEKDTEFTITADDWIWIETVFSSEDGSITSCELKVGEPWLGYPSLFTVDEDEETNTWFHPIAHVRLSLTEKGVSEPTAPDPGEFPELAEHHIAQKTNTHLVVVQDCIDGELIWKLQPGEGGKDPL